VNEKEERTCDCCGEIGAAYMTLAEAEVIFCTICYRCIATGVKWIVRQGKKE